MKIFSILILILLTEFTIVAQFTTKPTFPYKRVNVFGDSPTDTLPYLWYATDSVPEWESPHFNAYNKVSPSVHTVYQDSFVFRTVNKLEYFENAFLKAPLNNGLFITKRNMNSGELIWQNHYSDLEAGQQEMMMNTRINHIGNLEIIGYRRARPIESSNFQTGVFGFNDFDLRLFFREYDGKTGQLLHHLYPTSIDQNVAIISEGGPNNRTRLFFTPGDTTIRYFQTLFTDNTKQGYITMLLDRKGGIIGDIDSIITPTYQFPRIIQTKNNEYLVLVYNSFENTVELRYFDLMMNPLRTIKNKDFSIYSAFLTVPYPDSDYIEMHVTHNNFPPTYHNETLIAFMDEEGIVQDSFRRKYQAIRYFRTSEDYILGHQVQWDSEKKRPINTFFIKEKGAQMRDIKIYTSENNYYLNCLSMQVIEDKLLMYFQEQYEGDNNYRASSSMAFNLKDLGFPVKTKDLVWPPLGWQIYPNPTSDLVHITYDTPQNGHLEVFDAMGKSVYTKKVENSDQETISMSLWNTGLYWIKFTSKNGQTESRKVVKL